MVKRNYILEIQIVDEFGVPLSRVPVRNSESGSTLLTNENGIATFQLGYEKTYLVNFGTLGLLGGTVRGATRRVAVLR